jgi:hypothetical protein
MPVNSLSKLSTTHVASREVFQTKLRKVKNQVEKRTSKLSNRRLSVPEIIRPVTIRREVFSAVPFPNRRSRDPCPFAKFCRTRPRNIYSEAKTKSL